jgi:hypothetical protein
MNLRLSSMYFLHQRRPRSHLYSWQSSHSFQASTIPASTLSVSILCASRKASHRSSAVHSLTDLLLRASRRLRASASGWMGDLSDLSIMCASTQGTDNNETGTQWRVCCVLGRGGVLLPAPLGTSKSRVLRARESAQALVAHAVNLFRVAGLCTDRLVWVVGTTSVQLSERKGSALFLKRHQLKHLEFVVR